MPAKGFLLLPHDVSSTALTKEMRFVLRRHLGEILDELASHKELKIVEGHLIGDHVPIFLSIPPKYAESHVVEYIKEKSAIQIARKFGGRQKNFT